MFKAPIVSKAGNRVESAIATLDESAPPEGDVTVDVRYSTINDKDGLVLHARDNLVRIYRHAPGIDFAGMAGGRG